MQTSAGQWQQLPLLVDITLGELPQRIALQPLWPPRGCPLYWMNKKTFGE